MNIASRFPVKTSVPLFSFLIISHVSLFLYCPILIHSFTLVLLVLVVTAISFWESLSQYRLITNAPDDLCWSGENWLMGSSNLNDEVSYLDLLCSSWVTPQFCLLNFSCQGEHKSWLFTKRELGERLFRELCYLIKFSMPDSE